MQHTASNRACTAPAAVAVPAAVRRSRGQRAVPCDGTFTYAYTYAYTDAVRGRFTMLSFGDALPVP